MSRPLRVEFEHAAYHVTARGNERRRIFRSDSDRELFLTTLGQTVAHHELAVQAYCLMPNHYHLLVEMPRANLSQAIGDRRAPRADAAFRRRLEQLRQSDS